MKTTVFGNNAMEEFTKDVRLPKRGINIWSAGDLNNIQNLTSYIMTNFD